MNAARHAFVLSGGGANGAYEVGVMEALLAGRWHRRQPCVVSPSIFTGSSVGSFNAAAMVSLSGWGWPAATRKLREIWLERIAQADGRANGVFRMRRASHLGEVGTLTASWLQRCFDLAFSDESPRRRFLRSVDVTEMISTAPLKDLINQVIDVRGLLHSDSKLRIVASDWDAVEPVVFYNRLGRQETVENSDHDYRMRPLTRSNAAIAILASTAIPALFPRVIIENGYFADGGLVMNTPLHPAIEAGATVLHVISLESKSRPIKIGHAPSLIEAVEGILAGTPAQLIKRNIRHASLKKQVIQVARRLGRVLEDLDGNLDAVEDSDLGHLRAFVRRYADRPDVEIHRYFPSQELGGAMGLLDFRRHRLIELIELGFRNTVEHDCSANGCVV